MPIIAKIQAINVFPSQVESVLMKIPEIGDNYLIIVDLKGPLDVMTVKVEVTESAFSDKIADLMSLSKAVSQQFKACLILWLMLCWWSRERSRVRKVKHREL